MIGRLLRRLTGSTDRASGAERDTEETVEEGDHLDDPADGGRSSIWDLIPPRQYEGRYAESGGLQRSEQGQALADIQRQADAIGGTEAADAQTEVEDPR